MTALARLPVIPAAAHDLTGHDLIALADREIAPGVRLAGPDTGKTMTMTERRSDPRRAVRLATVVARASERRLPAATTIDISDAGVLVAFCEPVGLCPGDRVVVSIDFPDARFHCIAIVRRVARGVDFRTYAAVEFDFRGDEESVLRARLRGLDAHHTTAS